MAATALLQAAGTRGREQLLTVFPKSPVKAAADRGTCRFTKTYEPSGSMWNGALAAREPSVFAAALTHRQSWATGWRLGVGKGGAKAQVVRLTPQGAAPRPNPAAGHPRAWTAALGPLGR